MQDHERTEYERLRAKGRWPEANEFREAERKRLRAAGRSRQEACDESWELMLAEFHSSPVGAIDEAAKAPALMSVIPQRLLSGVNKHKTASVRDVAQWVFENSQTMLDSIAPDDVPSRGALGLLVWVQASPASYAEFIRTIWAKLLPSKGQLESEARFNDDGREQLTMLEEFEASFYANTAALQKS